MGKRNAEQSLDQSHLESTPLKQKKLNFDSPVCNQEFALTRELVDGTILTDLTKNQWRVGRPIGKFSTLYSLRFVENTQHVQIHTVGPIQYICILYGLTLSADNHLQFRFSSASLYPAFPFRPFKLFTY